jgi:hypothetical protein
MIDGASVPPHPYRGLPGSRFWASAMAETPIEAFDPVVGVPFTLGGDDHVAAAGSCFAQNIARHLMSAGLDYLIVEPPIRADAPLFPARFGNIYTLRQLRQLMLRAYGLHRPTEGTWRRADGRFIDPFRPQLFPEGFESEADVHLARRAHLGAVRRMFETCTVFVFTLGLTEAWLAEDGSVVPVPPGVLGVETNGEAYRFENFSVSAMSDDIGAFLADFRLVNPTVQVILTVSPVPLVATFEDRHVLVANTYSKAALRVVAEEAARTHDFVCYFPSYEIITAPSAHGRYFAADLRSVTEAGVAHVMSVFSRHFLDRQPRAPLPTRPGGLTDPRPLSDEALAGFEARAEILCDEERLDPST